ncbi:MAG TPA: DUF1385 domain-containing protein [bacterium]|nr:DUF1385 domain-containing protein [bacterium]
MAGCRPEKDSPLSVIGLIKKDDAPCPVREAKLYGGQAVIEGVLMKSATRAVVSVRESAPWVKNEKGKWIDPHKTLAPEVREALETQRAIVSKTLWELEGVPKKSWKQKPFARGIFVLFESLGLGMKALEFSAEVAGQSMGESEEQTPLQKAGSMAISIAFAVLLFIFIPTRGAEWLGNAVGLPHASEITNPWGATAFAKNALEGGLRIAVFITYILLIRSLFKEINRVFQYHGAEHKTVNAYEAMQPLTVESVQRMPTYHRRCGTSFVFLVAIVHIIIAALTGWPESVFVRLIRGIVLLAPVASVSYELLRLTAAHPTAWWSRMLSTPGIAFQKITALEPTDNMVEVAIHAFKQVVDEADIVGVEVPRQVALEAAE